MLKKRNLHPFPARMAPELALAAIRRLPRQGRVLDPMSGSGTVIQCAVDAGHSAVGVDADPLAVLMTRVRTASIECEKVKLLFDKVVKAAKRVDQGRVSLPWIDGDDETRKFTEFWFGEAQRDQLRAIASVLADFEKSGVRTQTRLHADVIRIALSRIIVTKEPAASLARDTSHSRPHKVVTTSEYNVYEGFERSVRQVLSILQERQGRFVGQSKVVLGDSRNLRSVCDNESVDLVVTSPPYLNAIDYLRGHRMALVWLGYTVSDVRNIRSRNIGAERGPENLSDEFRGIVETMGNVGHLPSRIQNIIVRYAEDLYRMMSEVRRVLVPRGQAVLVVGDSCLNGVFIKNSSATKAAAKMVGLRILTTRQRVLPVQSRYLPTPAVGNSLSKRMRTEAVIYLER